MRDTSSTAADPRHAEYAARWRMQVKERQEREAQERERLIKERWRLKQLHQNETLDQKVQRLVSEGLEYDAIRHLVEQDLPLLRPTTARIRQRREWIARLINDYRRRDPQGNSSSTALAEIKALYRQAAARLHPDRAVNEADRRYRNESMTLINLAYKAGNDAEIQALLHDHALRQQVNYAEVSPDRQAA